MDLFGNVRARDAPIPILGLESAELLQIMDSPASVTIKTIKPKEILSEENRQKQMKLCSLPIRLVCETLLVLIIFGPLLLFYAKWPAGKEHIYGKIWTKTRLEPASAGFESWINPPVKTIRAYRLFNVTNYMDVMTDRNDPTIEIEETKPLRYRLFVKKNNIKWLDDNKKIHYALERLFTREGDFDEELLNQEGAFVDILRVMFRTKFGRVANSVFYMLGGHNVFNYSKVVDKLEGYVSPIFSAISSRMQGPNKEKYGFIYRYNGSNGFNYTIHTGIHNSSIKGQVVNFASEYTPFTTEAEAWETDFFDGVTFPAVGNPPNRKVINVFQPDFCRPVQLRYNRTVSRFGFDQLHEFVLKLVDFNQCPQMDENCTESDKLDITSCLSAELPAETVFLTKPHMYGHNSSSTNVAFKPDFHKHESTIYFEPLTGTPIKAQLRIQLNTNAWIDRIRINDLGATEPTNSRAVRRLIPMVWIDQTITLNEETASAIRSAFRILRTGESVHQSLKLAYIIVALFSVIAAIGVTELFFWNRRRRTLELKDKGLYLFAQYLIMNAQDLFFLSNA
ncbi:unnamed protein product [Rotaria sordida]|uniref:Uncharacterized protein n=1 Tax=Rotaria sordida TaxID=392033 RepID=A0A813YAN4_9BILA|nr:unnamed protein product [Rotaria sordida]